MKNHVMIDLETLGTVSGSVIVSIGACLFDIEKDYKANNLADLNDNDLFEANIDIESSIEMGFTTDEDTLKWWSQQKSEVMEEFLKNTQPLTKVLNDFKLWCENKNVKYSWSHGAAFDIAMLEFAFKKCKLETPWKFWDVRDTRTTLWFAYGNELSKTDDFGDKHNALHDTLAQVFRIQKAYKIIKGK